MNTTTPLATALLAPRSVALVGASADAAKNTARPLRFLRRHGYTGAVYPINPARPEVLGERAWPSLAELPEPVDHVFVMVPGSQAMDVLEQCAINGSRLMTLYSDGFGEAGEAGAARQAALVARARQLGVRLLGPNCIGTANLHTGGILSVNAVFEMADMPAGDIALVSQSGSMMGSLLSRAAGRGFGFSSSISVGNECDVSVGEVVDALVDDPNTRAILLFLETVRRADLLSAALGRAARAGKPVLAYKLGRSAVGSALAQSHTGALAGDDAAVDAFLQAHGVIRVHTLEALFEAAPLAARYATPALPAGVAAPRVAVITTTGGGAATVVDNLGLQGVQAVEPPADFIARMAGHGLTIRPAPVIDMTLAASSAQYRLLLEHLLRSDWCDAVLSVAGSSAQFHPALAVEPLLQAEKPTDKPLVAFLAPDATESLRTLQRAGIAAFRTPESCADALAAFFRRRPPAPRPLAAPALWPEHVPTAGRLTEYEAGLVFAGLGLRTAATRRLALDDLAHDLAYPVVLKISSRDIAHKTEVGGVRPGVADQAALEAAARTMHQAVGQAAPEAKLEGFLVQSMEPRLIELILGLRHDPQVGPIVVLGAGGVTAELSPDVAVRLAPVSLDEAHAMIEAVRHTRLVRGFRGLPTADCAALARAIVDFSRLATLASPRIAEAEINPLFVRQDGVVAVDGLIVLDEGTPPPTPTDTVKTA